MNKSFPWKIYSQTLLGFSTAVLFFRLGRSFTMPQSQLTGPIRFGAFEVDPHSVVVRKLGVRIRLQEQPFRVLLVLLEKPGEVVAREELQRRVWPTSEFGEVDHYLNIAINKIRETLGDSAETPRFIETVPRRGYRFIAALDGSPVTAVVPSPAAERHFKLGWIFLAGAALALLALSAISLLPPGPPRELQHRRLTHDNSPKFNPVLSDGARLYFRSGTRTDWRILQVPLAGGEPVVLPVVLPAARLSLLDITPDGQELLITASESAGVGPDPLWAVRIADGSSRRIGDLSVTEARYSPDGSRIAFTAGGVLAPGSLSVASGDGSHPKLLLQLKGLAIVAPCWSADGRRIAFGQLNQASQFGSTWEIMADGSRVRRLFPDWHESHLPAGWTPDGRLVLVSGGRLWTVPPRRILQSGPSLPSPVSPTEPRFDGLIQLRGSGAFYAAGSTPLGHLQRFDTQRSDWEPNLGGISADTVEYSRDGRSVAYSSYPQREVFIRRVDGRPVQLTKPPMEAWIPRWSPDGSRIAFLGKITPDQPWRIYLADAEGGAIRPGCPADCGPQGDFTWAPGGKTIVYAAPNERYLSGENLLRVLEVDTGRVTNFEGTVKFYSPRWAPDGSVLAALAERSAVRERSLMLYRPSDRKWVEAAAPPSGFLSWPAWSSDSKSLLYFNRLRGVIGRYWVKENRHEDVVRVKPDELSGPVYWFNLTANNEPMILRRRDIQEIYALDWKQP
jgi:DNA-binding winged helix-turn-helix (wHTH) protein/Tol biopolymer transport system component